MKVGIPVDDRTMDGNVCQSFGRAPYFLIYDTEAKESSYIDNQGASSQGGAGIRAAQLIADSGAEALITPRCGGNAAAVMKMGKIEIYRSMEGSIEDNLAAFESGDLAILDETHEGFHNHGGQ